MTISIPGQPVAKGRPRFARPKQRWGGKVSTYTPTKTIRWQTTARWYMASAMKEQGLKPQRGPVSLTVFAYFECPQSKRRKRSRTPQQWHTGRGDIDNVVKAVADAGNGILWLDDSQVAELVARKFVAAQSEAPRVDVVVTPLTETSAATVSTWGRLARTLSEEWWA